MKNNKDINEMLGFLIKDEVWKKLSKENAWTEAQIAAFEMKIDWDALSENEKVFWTVDLVERYKDRMNWEYLSENEAKTLKKIAFIRRFSDKWDWTILTEKIYWTLDFIGEFKDYLNWKVLVSGTSREFFPIVLTFSYKSLLEQFPEYLTRLEFEDFFGSDFLNELVENEAFILAKTLNTQNWTFVESSYSNR